MNTQTTNVDLTYLDTITEGNQTFAKTLLTSAVKDLEVKMSSFMSFWKKQDPAGIKSAAHSMISLSAIAGVPAISGWCRTVEQSIKAGAAPSEMEALVDDITATWSDALPELLQLIAA